MLSVAKEKKRRGVFAGTTLLSGVVYTPDPELVPDDAVISCDGVISFQGVLKKDFSIIKCTDVIDNIDYYSKQYLCTCGSGSEVNPVNSTDPPIPSKEVVEN